MVRVGKNKSTNNVIVKFWSKKSYPEVKSMYYGVVVDTQTNESFTFYGPGQLLRLLERIYRKAERRMRAVWTDGRI